MSAHYNTNTRITVIIYIYISIFVTDHGRGYTALHFFFRTIFKPDALPPHARIILLCTIYACSLHGLRMRNRLARARRFGGRWLLFRIIIISFLGPWNYIVYIIIISDREETSYSSSRQLTERHKKKYPVLLFSLYSCMLQYNNTFPAYNFYFYFFVISCFMHVVNPVTLSRRFI